MRVGGPSVLVTLGALAFACADSSQSERGAERSERSIRALGRAERELVQFGLALPGGRARPSLSPAAGGFGALLPATRFQRPELRLPEHADGAFSLVDRVSGAEVAVQLDDSRVGHVAGELSDGAVVYAGRDAMVVHAARADGTEDHVIVRAGEAVVRYRLELERGVAALRVIDGVVELLDVGGAPRIRIAAPFVADARGRRHPVSLAVEGCHYDSDPRPPWGRPLVTPGATSCTLRMAWEGVRVGLPALLDPIWSLTGNMAFTRDRFGLVTLGTGKVLAACDAVQSELYDAASGTWALTGSTSSLFSSCSATALTDGRVLLVSGTKSATYDPTSGQWTDRGPLAVSRLYHGAERLSNGKVLVAGGYLSTSPWATATAEIFDPGTGSWTATTSMLNARRDISLTALPGGRVLALRDLTAEVYDEASAVWSAAAPPPSDFDGHFALPLPSGQVFVGGGYSSKATAFFNPTAGTWTAGPSLHWERWDGSALLLANGNVLVTGGWDSTTLGGEVEEAERYVPALNQWISSGSLQYLRYDHRSALLPNGDAIVAGGASVIIDNIDSVERLTLVPNGGACKTAGECDSAYCVGGICCNEPCGGLCRTCRASEKASGADGVCGFAKLGVDPKDQCADQGAASCGTSGACDGAGSCEKYASGTACAAPSCQNGTLNTSTCSAQGVCVQSSQSCSPYACADGLACGSSCTIDAQCLAPATCDLAQGKCVAPQSNGAQCSGPKQCASGHCVDGVCCDSACLGACKACSAQVKGGGNDGECGNVVAGQDPDGDCPTDSAASCQRDGACAGNGSCRLYAAGTPCGSTTCVGNQQQGAACDGGGTCSASASVDCGAYACAGSSCNTSCSASADCAPSAWCDSGKCQPRTALGGACSSSDQCESGFCVDGVCCSTPCTDQCVACDTPGALGLCVPVKGAPRGGRPACDPAAGGNACSAKTCDGVERTSCNAFVGADVECRKGSCSDGVAVLAAKCDGFGSCPVEQSTACEPYACGADQCKATCSADSDCAAGASCSTTGECVAGAVCAGPSTLRDAEGAVVECAPYACSAGACRSSCASILDCAPGSVCQSGGVCGGASSSSGDDGGCALASGRSSAPGALALWATILAFFASTRRRRHAIRNR